MSATFPRRGEIYYTNLDLVFGSEQGGRRPVLIIQNDPNNQYSPVVIIASITSTPARSTRPTDVSIAAGEAGLTKQSRILLNQLRTLDKRRLGRHVGQLDDTQMEQVDQALMMSLGLSTRRSK
ncbi:MAG: type II toxin-antitoxin system PemK/MazF family toxin [Roseiflexaceae bacterium]